MLGFGVNVVNTYYCLGDVGVWFGVKVVMVYLRGVDV